MESWMEVNTNRNRCLKLVYFEYGRLSSTLSGANSVPPHHKVQWLSDSLTIMDRLDRCLLRWQDFQRRDLWYTKLPFNLRYAVRTLSKSPGFALMAIATLALGNRANTAIFSVAQALLLRPLPYPHPERLVLVYAAKGDMPGAIQPFSFPRATFLSERARIFRICGIH